ncbi:MAG: response regulator [Nitrospirota bacterium]
MDWRKEQEGPYDRQQGLGRTTVLLVENKEVTACLLAFVLQKNGYRVIHSNNGAHAKSVMSAINPPDAVLLDRALPDTTGLELPACMRTQEHWHRIPVAMLTTNADTLDPRQAVGLGGNDSILKPVSPTRLATRLNRLLTGMRAFLLTIPQ